jgi:hypothetical protein
MVSSKEVSGSCYLASNPQESSPSLELNFHFSSKLKFAVGASSLGGTGFELRPLGKCSYHLSHASKPSSLLS